MPNGSGREWLRHQPAPSSRFSPAMTGLTGEATGIVNDPLKIVWQAIPLKQKGLALLLKKSDVRGLKSDVSIAHYFIDKSPFCVIN